MFCVGEKFRKPSLQKADSSSKFLKLFTSEAWSFSSDECVEPQRRWSVGTEA